MTRKFTFPSEIAYFLVLIFMSLSVAMTAAADFGVSMIVAPAYVFSLKFPALTFGQWEYVIQGALFITLCLILRGFKVSFLVSFLSCLIYGGFLDLWRTIIPAFNPAVTDFSLQPIWLRIIFLACGMTLTAFTVALSFQVYLYPQVYDFFVKGVVGKFKFDLTKFKLIFDLCFLITGVALSLIFFHGFKGIGVGTLIMTALNGFLIGFFDKQLRAHLTCAPLAKKLCAYFNF